MLIATDVADNLASFRFGTGPAAEGRKAALRSIYAHHTSLDASLTDDLTKVRNGSAPQAFKDAYEATLRGLCAVLADPAGA